MAVLSYDDLNDSLIDVLAYRQGFNPLFFDAFSIYYETGIRTSELLVKENWVYSGGDVLTLNPLKSNSQRVFDLSIFPSTFLDWVIGDRNSYDFITERILVYNFQMMYEFPRASVGGRETAIYLFRYRYVKSLFLSGMSAEDVRVHMGWASVFIANRYNSAVIEV